MQPDHITISAHTELVAERNRARVIAVALEQELAELRDAAESLVDYLLSLDGPPGIEHNPIFERLAMAVAS